MRTKLTLIAATGALLTACGGANKDDKPDTQTIQYDQIKATPQTEQGLRLADEAMVKQHIANGLRLQLSGTGGSRLMDGGPTGGSNSSSGAAAPVPTTVTESAPAPKDAAGDSTGRFSGTNVHVQGVDEADLAKYDGSHWFIANQPSYDAYLAVSSQPTIDVVATDPAMANVEFVGQVQFDEAWGSVRDMYLVQTQQVTSHIAAIRHQWGNVMPLLPGMPIDLQVDPIQPEVARLSIAWPGPVNSQVQLQLLDVSSPATPTMDWRVDIDGSLIDSRKVGNTLYLVTRYDPWLADLSFEYGDSSVREQNEAALTKADVEQLMPHYYVGDSKTPLATDCYLQADVGEEHGYSHLVNITAIDLSGKRVISSTCLNSGVEAMSMSQDNVYLTGTVYDSRSGSAQTVIHKFALTEQGAQYAATGSVVGGLGWSSDPAFRMHEAGEHFRIVTSQHRGNGPEHQLSILRDDKSGLLEPVATLPNTTRPDPIGKPGEDIYSVRFQGDTAYIVTFQRTDPLYAIDLSDPLDPRIAGELEIPGFATYMHPLPNNYLFTLGRDADTNGRALGIKAELVKVTDGTPEVINTVFIGGQDSQSEALQNLRALSVLNVSEQEVRFAFPVTHYREDYVTGLQLLQIDGIDGDDAQLRDQGMIIATSGTDDLGRLPGQGTARGILHDDAAFLSFNRGIWAAYWAAPENSVGPIRAEPVVCDAQYVYGLHVSVNTEGELNACDATVTATTLSGDAIELLMPEENASDRNRCTFYGAGETAGDFYVSATLPGLPEANTKVRVLRDECHVIPEKIELTLRDEDPVFCTTEVVPSIHLDLISEENADADLCEANVIAINDGEQYRLDAFPASDENSPSCSFRGPGEVGGAFTLQVSLDGYEPLLVDGIYVEKGVCHVATEHVTATLISQ